MSIPPTYKLPIRLAESLTHWGWDRMAAIFQRAFSNAFSWKKMYHFRLIFHWRLFTRVQLTLFQLWFRWWYSNGQVTSHYLNQWRPSLLMHICFTWPQWVNTVRSRNNNTQLNIVSHAAWQGWDFELTKATPHLTVISKLWGVNYR